ncbi:MAG: serine/threonine-protein kinase [Acidobacteriota bacterium]
MNARVLLIDGDAGWASAATQRFAILRPSLPVERYATARDAIAAAERGPVSLAVANLVLPRPGIGGASALARLRELYPACHTLLITDHEALGGLLADAAEALFAPREQERWLEYVVSLTDDMGDKVLDLDASTIIVGESSATEGAALFSTEPKADREKLVGDRYRPIEKIGHGGMGQVWRAEDTFIKRHVALKLMKVPKTADPEEMRLRMRREVIIAGRLSHPHVVTVFDAGLEGRDVFLVMELIPGPTLSEALKAEGPLESARAVALCQQILGALSLAHQEGFIHRDLKPSNVLMANSETVKVADFGLAKLLRDGDGEASPKLLNRELTQPEYAVGTPPYMAPEQLRCEAVDGRADLYAVGLLLFEMLHGVSLAHFQKPLARARAVTEPRFDVPIPELRSEPSIHKVLVRALAVRPGERFQDAESFADALDGARSSWQKHLPRPFKRRSRE